MCSSPHQGHFLLMADEVNRAGALGSGIRALLGARNGVAALHLCEPFLRTLLRLHSLLLVDLPAAHASQLRAGTPLDELCDRNGNFLSTDYLIESFERVHNVSWLLPRHVAVEQYCMRSTIFPKHNAPSASPLADDFLLAFVREYVGLLETSISALSVRLENIL